MKRDEIRRGLTLRRLILGGFLLALPGFARQSSAQNDLARAQLLIAHQRWDEADRVLEALLSREPNNVSAWIDLGQVQAAQRLNEAAMTSYESALRLAPHAAPAAQGEVKAAEAEALTRRGMGDPGGALAVLLRARRCVPGSPELLTDFGIQADSMQLYRDADEALTRAHSLAPTDARALYALAHVELDEQKVADSERHLRAYLALRPDDASAHYGLGHLLYMTSRNDAAQAELERSIALEPKQTESYYELGEIAREQNRDALAKSDYARVLSAAPDHGGALTGLGVLAYRQKDYSAAKRYLDRAVQVSPEYVPAHRYLAMTLARLGEQSESAQESATAERLTEEQDRTRHGYALMGKQP